MWWKIQLCNDRDSDGDDGDEDAGNDDDRYIMENTGEE